MSILYSYSHIYSFYKTFKISAVINRSEVLPKLGQDDKWVCFSFGEASRRYGTLRSEVKDSLLLTASAVCGMSSFLCQFPKCRFPQGNMRRAT